MANEQHFSYLYVENELESIHFYFDTIWLGNK